ncbi:MAG: twin-arginine translocase TatA/TatE family subunit [Alphaproteobacteria bacterium]|nr:twin-arginine translocase TatA/TatE family subunit [Alphaproteobacteria bacterium]MBV9860824.1 twin-arginine translocase TatA/TatE family subunit [Alphaproteobacteria bacterium]
MGSFSVWHWMLVLAVVLIVFGAGKLPRVMGDFAKGIKAFKAGMQDEEPEVTVPPPQVPPPVEASAAQPVSARSPGQPTNIADRQRGRV